VEEFHFMTAAHLHAALHDKTTEPAALTQHILIRASTLRLDKAQKYRDERIPGLRDGVLSVVDIVRV